MAIKDTIINVQKIEYEIRQILADLQALAQKGLIYLKDSDSEIITMTSDQKQALITKYNGLKMKLINKVNELP